MIGRSLVYFRVILFLYSHVAVSAARTSINVTGLGVQGALDKPFGMERFLATVQRYCPSAPPPE
jgi:hypothetical protein